MLEISPKSTEDEPIDRAAGTPLQRESAGRRRSILAHLTTFFDTLLVAALAVALVVGAHTLLSWRVAMAPAGTVAQPLSVATTTVQMVDAYRVPRQFVGQVEPAQTTQIAFELAGRVDRVLVDEAALVEQGQPLAELDTGILENRRETQRAARRAIEARMEKSRLTTDRRKQLNDKGFLASQSLDNARLELDELQALREQVDSSIAGIDIEIEKSIIRAPFDGRIGDRFVDVGTTVASGQPILTIMQNAAPELRVGLSDEVASNISVGELVTARIGSRSYQARLAQLRADLDPRTRTHTAIFTLQLADGDATPLYGQIGIVTLWQSVQQRGAWVPVTALRDGTRGLWTVLSVGPSVADGQSTLSGEAVEILYADQERAFVRGTFRDDARIVESGLHRLTAGQTVRLPDAAW